MQDFIFFLDILLNFRTSYLDDNNEIVVEKKKIRTKYLGFWFSFDVVSVFPFELIGLCYDKNTLDPRLRVFRLLCAPSPFPLPAHSFLDWGRRGRLCRRARSRSGMDC